LAWPACIPDHGEGERPSVIRTGLRLVKETIDRCQKHNTPLLAAALAFYTVLSLAPGLWIVVAAAGIFVGRESARDQVLAWATVMIGPRSAGFVGSILDGMTANTSFATVAGLVSMFFGATVAFSALQDALNTVWDVPPKDRHYIAEFFLKRLVSFLAVLALGVMLLASLMASAAISAVAHFAPRLLPAPELLLNAADFVVAIVFITLLFAVTYRILPDTAVDWRDAWTGATVTAILFTIGKALIGWYLGHTGLRSAYGAAGSFVILLLWVYYSTQIFLFGAEFAEVYAVTRRKRR
jgi:membrane protein